MQFIDAQKCFKPPSSFSTDRSNAVSLLQFFYVRALMVSYVWRLFCHSLFLVSPSSCASGRLCVVIVAFPGPWYHPLRKHAYSNILKILSPKN